MKKLLLFLIILTSCNTKTEEKNNLENSIWKFCGETGHISDILVFSKEHLYVKNDSIYFHNSKSLIGIIDRVENYYGERRLYVKDLNGNVGRYCKQ
ncbi:hypothetical protein [Kaistella carnis]|uniref:Uncharacterized protein n=1 Tax=Kaistella carnis TaxID=1241979 RepID=A0A3G8XJU4_9FLAO|nr:hypothetical protein [Kaistella carnis]AZI32027.1 hypothetical protein EIB73_02025 [Kaistella carnis]